MAIQKDSNGMVNIDAEQVVRTQAHVVSDGSLVQKTLAAGGSLVPDMYNEISLTYNGAGEIATATYKYNSSTICTLTLSYDGSNRLINVVRS